MKNLFYSFIFLSSGYILAQPMKVSNVISENKITSFSEQKLILIDFWATWCAPCIYATQQLEISQEINKDKVFMISISDEHESKIKTYLDKRPIDLMVTSDYENYTFSKYEVNTRPFAVLLDIKGNLLWKGNPSELSQQKLDQFYLAQSHVNSLKKIEKIMEVKNEEIASKNILIDNQKLLIYELKDDQSELINSDEEVYFTGTLDNLFFNLKKMNPYEIQFEQDTNKRIKLIATKAMWEFEKDKIIEEVLLFFDLKSETNESELTGIELEVKHSNMLWDSSQFDWEGSPVNYIVGTDRIQADNMSIKEICSLLGKNKGANYIYIGDNDTKYDWDFQYLYDELMVEEFESSFGIKFNPTKILTSVITISKN